MNPVGVGSVRRIGLFLCVIAMGSAGSFADEAVSSNSKPSNRPLSGINLASGEFAPGRIPGRFGQDYIYPTKEVAAPFIASGMQIVRIPILWERIQPDPNAPLDSTELLRIDRVISDMIGFEMVVLDIHNYGRFRGQRLDENETLKGAFANLWMQLAIRYKNADKVAFGLMNEPNGMSARSARLLADAAVAAIRKTGGSNLILIPGTRWTGAHSWTAGGSESNASAFADFHDPRNHFMFDLHSYLDADASGTKADCPSALVGVERLTQVTGWLRQQRQQAVLGEFGSSTQPVCLDAMNRMLAYMDANADVWRGWTYWAGGAWWGDYFMNIQPEGDVLRPQMRVLLEHMSKPGSPPRR